MSLRALLLAAFSYVLLLMAIAFAIPLSHVFTERVEGEVRSQALAQAELVAVVAGSSSRADGTVLAARRATLQRTVDAAARITRGRVIVVDSSGALQVDSAKPPAAAGADYSSRPEIRAALAGRAMQEQRDSATLGRPLLVTAAPARNARNDVVGSVRVSQDVGAISRAVWRGRLALLGLGGLVLALGFAVALWIARRLSQPLAALEDAAHRVADGDMTAAAPETGSSEQVEVARAFNVMTGRLDRTLSAQQQFVANASHQLRTPLTGVRLRIEEARHDASPESADHLDAATDEVDRLSATIDDLLTLSRAGERPQAARPVDLGGLAEAAAERVRGAARRDHREVTVHTEGAEVVLADAADLARILDVFLENALAYGGRGPIEVVAAGRAVSVSDRGPGLAQGEDDGRLLERFRRGAAGRGRAGTGLGLAIASALATQWGCSVSLRRREGGGATATLDCTGA
ncbi:MAG: HAMP domain-containing histidine kinase [Solirubrobacteraceae bacterium]|nr:HAMP domain-containing histidine kinase [Solirubrobacteraceae bacterium]